jgi:hypothetical protein
MVRLSGHFDGQHVVLDQPPPPELLPNTPVEVVLLTAKEQAFREMQAYLDELWSRPLPPNVQPDGDRGWTREELYDRSAHRLP